MQNNKRPFERFGCGSCARDAKESFLNANCDSDSCKLSFENDDSDKVYRRIIQYGISAILFAIALLFNLLGYIKFTLFFISYIIAGGDVVLKATKNILKGQIFDEYFLMSIATIGAFAIGEYPESVAVMLFYQIGELLQDIAVDRSKRSIKELMNIRPDYAT